MNLREERVHDLVCLNVSEHVEVAPMLPLGLGRKQVVPYLLVPLRERELPRHGDEWLRMMPKEVCRDIALRKV